MQFYFSLIVIMTAGGAYTLKHETIGEFTIPVINKKEQQSFIALVNQILSIKKSDSQEDTKKLETEIDRMIYELYGLTEEEIAIVEENLEKKNR